MSKQRKFLVVKILKGEVRVSQTSQKEYYLFDTDQGKFNCFDMTLGDDLNRTIAKNENVEIEYTENMGFKTIVSASPAPLGSSIAKSSETIKPFFNLAENNRQASIEAQCALKAAVDYWTHHNLMLNIDAEKEEFLKTVEFFYTVIDKVRK